METLSCWCRSVHWKHSHLLQKVHKLCAIRGSEHSEQHFSMVVAGSRVLGESVRKIAISSRAALAVVRQGHGKPLTQLELHTTL